MLCEHWEGIEVKLEKELRIQANLSRCWPENEVYKGYRYMPTSWADGPELLRKDLAPASV